MKTTQTTVRSAIGTVYLRVNDLDKQIKFYKDIIGLQVHRRDWEVTYLGTGGEDLLALIHTPNANRERSTTGLYHFALLLPTRYDLALSLKHLADTRTPLQGLSDHIVSEAIYLADPEGNGIEIYWDRPREQWFKNGRMQLSTLPMDVDGVMSTLDGQDTKWKRLPADTVMGHIHLHVANIPETERFYRDVLGLDVLFNVGSALFMSYNGYHHHIGANIWGGRSIPNPDAAGLDHFILRVDDEKQHNAIITRLDTASIDYEQVEDTTILRDPSHNTIHLIQQIE